VYSFLVNYDASEDKNNATARGSSLIDARSVLIEATTNIVSLKVLLE
jgi:hypothetical protein